MEDVMLILTRNNDQSLIVTTSNGEIIQFRILDVRRGKVRVGVSALDDCKVLRDELLLVKGVE
jgi:sRNA-binding carbon storage regulator CsrA